MRHALGASKSFNYVSYHYMKTVVFQITAVCSSLAIWWRHSKICCFRFWLGSCLPFSTSIVTFVAIYHKKQKTRPGSLFKWEAWPLPSSNLRNTSSMRFQAAEHRSIVHHKMTHGNKGSHNLNIHIYCSLWTKNTTKHSHTLLCKGIR